MGVVFQKAGTMIIKWLDLILWWLDGYWVKRNPLDVDMIGHN